MSMTILGRFAEKLGGQQLGRVSGSNSVRHSFQLQMADSFLKSSPLKVEEFRAVAKEFKTRLKTWNAKVSIKKWNYLGKKINHMTIQYGENVKTFHNHRDLKSALQDGEKFSQLSKSLPEGAYVRSERPDQLELYLPGRSSVVYTDTQPEKVFTEFYGRVPQYQMKGVYVSKFTKAQKLIDLFKDNND